MEHVQHLMRERHLPIYYAHGNNLNRMYIWEYSPTMSSVQSSSVLVTFHMDCRQSMWPSSSVHRIHHRPSSVNWYNSYRHRSYSNRNRLHSPSSHSCPIGYHCNVYNCRMRWYFDIGWWLRSVNDARYGQYHRYHRRYWSSSHDWYYYCYCCCHFPTCFRYVQYHNQNLVDTTSMQWPDRATLPPPFDRSTWIDHWIELDEQKCNSNVDEDLTVRSLWNVNDRCGQSRGIEVSWFSSRSIRTWQGILYLYIRTKKKWKKKRKWRMNE